MWPKFSSVLYDLLTSKKALATIAGTIVAATAKIGLELDTEAVLAIVGPTIAYILGQGMADLGKEAKK